MKFFPILNCLLHYIQFNLSGVLVFFCIMAFVGVCFHTEKFYFLIYFPLSLYKSFFSVYEYLFYIPNQQ